MGLFLQNHENYETFVKNRTNSTNGANYGYNNGDMASYFVNSGVSIFGTLLQKIGDGKGGDDDGEISEKKQKQIDEYQSKIDAKLKEAAVNTVKELEDKITSTKEKQTTINGKITECNNNLCSIQNDIDELNKLLETATSEEDKTRINAQITELNKNKKDITTERNQQVEALKKAEREEAVLQAQMAEVENLQHNIDKIKKELPKEVSYNVKKETNDLATFTDAMKKFSKNPSQENADALYNAYHGGHKGVQNATAQKAYDYIVKEYPNLFKNHPVKK